MQINPKLLEKIILAVPDIQARNTSVRIPKPFSGLINYRDDTIRLNDVLVAMNKKNGEWDFVIALDGHILKQIRNNENGFAEFEGTGVYWNNIDDITQQSKKLLDLLEKILL